MKQDILIKCPRCLGKGNIDLNDIHRLNRQLDWAPGICIYCLGSGKVNASIFNNISPDDIFLNENMTNEERANYIHDPANYISKINFLNSLENKSDKEKRELIKKYYSERVIYFINTEFWSDEKIESWLIKEEVSIDLCEQIIKDARAEIFMNEARSNYKDNRLNNYFSNILYVVIGLIVLVILILKIDFDSINYKIILMLLVSAIGSVVVTPMISSRNNTIKIQDLSLSNKINNKKDERENTILVSNNESYSAELKKENSNLQDINNSGKLLGSYMYLKKGYKEIFICCIIFFLIGLIFISSDWGKLSLILSGMGLFVIIFMYLEYESYEYSDFLYKLYDDKIECYSDKETFFYSITFEDIKKIDSEYEYAKGRYGKEIDKVFYVFMINDKDEKYKIEVKNLFNIESKTNFRDDFIKIYIPTT